MNRQMICFEKGCPTNTTMPNGIMGNGILPLLDGSSRCFNAIEGDSRSMCFH